MLIDRLESSIFKLDAAQGSAVKTMKAEVETLSNIESVSSAMKQFISRTKDRENLKAVFGGEKGKLAKAWTPCQGRSLSLCFSPSALSLCAFGPRTVLPEVSPM